MSESLSHVLNRDDIRDTATSKKYLDAGMKSEKSGERLKAIEAYEAAFAADPDNGEVCFRLAYALDLVGEEDEALHLYEQCAQQPKPALNALMNLAVLYEDRGLYVQAERCLRQVLSTDPNNLRAQLYLKDVEASRAMVVEEEETPLLITDSAVLDTPVTDFELSLKTRNALRKMNVRTLGDLLRMTEAELRAYKNLGDESIEEIRTMLAQRGLRLGQSVEQQQSAAKKQVYEQLKTQAGGDEEMLGRSVNELQLSVRARKALALLNIQSLGDLCMRTEAELMGVKNFGMTSLLEIKAKLEDLGLALRKLDEPEDKDAENEEKPEKQAETLQRLLSRPVRSTIFQVSLAPAV